MPPRPRRRRVSRAEEEGDQVKTVLPLSEEPGHKRQVQMGLAAVRGGGGGGGQGGEGGCGDAAGEAARLDREILVKMDSRVLDCVVCYDPLKPPIYQCEVGHVLCFVCRGKLSNSCPICFRVIGFCRCFALEQMVDTIKVPCSNAIYGCHKYITYHQKQMHETTCVHAPCFCPEVGCSFKGLTGSLRNHFVTEHNWSLTNLHYDKAQRISMPQDRRFALLVGEDQSMFLVVNTLSDIGNALSTICIRSHESSGSCYSSKISAIHRTAAEKGRYLFQMDPHVGSSSLHGGVQLDRFFLLVPPELIDESTNELTFNISIEKIKCALHN